MDKGAEGGARGGGGGWAVKEEEAEVAEVVAMAVELRICKIYLNCWANSVLAVVRYVRYAQL